MAGVCVEGWLDLHCIIQQTLLCVPESTTIQELLTKEVGSKLASRDCLEDSLTASVSPTGKCHKPQGIYAQRVFSAKEKKQLEVLKEMVYYTCGSPIITEGSASIATVFLARGLRCYDHVEFAFPRKKP